MLATAGRDPRIFQVWVRPQSSEARPVGTGCEATLGKCVHRPPELLGDLAMMLMPAGLEAGPGGPRDISIWETEAALFSQFSGKDV